MTEQCDAGTTCATEQSAGDCCDMPEKLLALADEAWHEVLKDKIKAEILKSCDDRMNKLAQLVTETNKAKWTHTIQGKVKCEEYKNSLKAFFTSDCSD